MSLNAAKQARAQGDARGAVKSCLELLSQNPADVRAHCLLSEIHRDLGMGGEALRYASLAVSASRVAPMTPEAQFELGALLLALGRGELAVEPLEGVLANRPGNPVVLHNLGVALRAAGRVEEAEACYRQALAAQPDRADTRMNLAIALLQQGKFAEGWAEFEHRWEAPGFRTPRREFDKPRWDGAPLGDGTLLIHAEQGLGDAIAFARFFALAAERVGRVVVECRPRLTRLLASAPGVDEVYDWGDPFPDHDAQIPVMSLAHVLGVTLSDLPSDPYLTVPKGVAKPDVPGEGVRIGLVWQGTGTRIDNDTRSCTLEKLGPLLELEGASFYSLQVGAGSGELAAFPQVVDLAQGLVDFADTAALVNEMDLIVSVDTAMAHLAGALGKPAWIPLAFSTSHLWLLDRNDSPWYPTHRLVRQAFPGDWNGVAMALADGIRPLLPRT